MYMLPIAIDWLFREGLNSAKATDKVFFYIANLIAISL